MVQAPDQLGRHHHRLGVGVLEQVVELLFEVAVVDVDGHAPGLERPEGGLQVLVAVVEVEGDLGVRAQAGRGQVAGHPRRPLVELAPGPLHRAVHQCGPVGDLVRDGLPRRGQAHGRGHPRGLRRAHRSSVVIAGPPTAPEHRHVRSQAHYCPIARSIRRSHHARPQGRLASRSRVLHQPRRLGGHRARPGPPRRPAPRPGRAGRLGRPAALRCAPHRPLLHLHQARRALPQRVLRPGRAVPARQRWRHRVRAGRLPPLRAHRRGPGPPGDGHRLRPARRGRLLQHVPARGRDHRRAPPLRQRPRPGADRGVQRELPPHLRPAPGPHAPAPPERDRRAGGDRRHADQPGGRRAQRRRPGHRRARPPLHPRRLHAADGHRGHPVAHRHPAGRGTWRRLRRPLRDVHHRADEAAPGRARSPTATRASSTGSR